jgi:hypothetical protein
MFNNIRTYAELRTQVRNALRNEHPEWVGPEGNSPICDAYEARLAELLDLFAARERSAGTRSHEKSSGSKSRTESLPFISSISY